MKWECDKCGRCCKFWDVKIDENDIKKIEKLGYNRRKFTMKKNKKIIIRKKFGKCYFLKNNECIIQKFYGYDYKPQICRNFPFSKNASQIICGNFIEVKKINSAKIDGKKSFKIRGKIMPTKTFFYALSRLNSKNYTGTWNKILSSIPELDKKAVSEHDIDNIISSGKKTPNPSDLLMKSRMASLIFPYIYGLFMLCSEKPVSLNLPAGKFRFQINCNDIKIKESDIDNFIGILRKGHGIVYKPHFLWHLLFSFYFLEDFAKNIAKEDGRKTANLMDLVNGYSKLNSIIGLPSYRLL